MRSVKALAQRVKRTRADVAVDDAEGEDRELEEVSAARLFAMMILCVLSLGQSLSCGSWSATTGEYTTALKVSLPRRNGRVRLSSGTSCSFRKNGDFVISRREH